MRGEKYKMLAFKTGHEVCRKNTKCRPLKFKWTVLSDQEELSEATQLVTHPH